MYVDKLHVLLYFAYCSVYASCVRTVMMWRAIGQNGSKGVMSKELDNFKIKQYQNAQFGRIM